MRTALIIILASIGIFSYAQDTLKLYYPINVSTLTKEKKSELNKFLSSINIDKVAVIGYADYLGSQKKNQILSKSRAVKVKNYILNKGVKVTEATGKGTTGPTLDHSKGIQKYRRVDVVKYKKGNLAEKTDSISSEPLDEKIRELKVGEKLVLKNFNFIPGRHYLLVESKPELSKLIDIMIANPSLKIELHGHICCETTHEDGWDIDDMNYKLSENRAKYIFQQLVKNGISADRMTYKGFGRTTPLYPLELDEAQKNANRRVEILIVEK